jgi:hypothetical protein
MKLDLGAPWNHRRSDFKGKLKRLSNKAEAYQGGPSAKLERTPTQGCQVAIASPIWHPLATLEPKQRIRTQAVIGGSTC